MNDLEDWQKPSEALRKIADQKPTLKPICDGCRHRHNHGEFCAYSQGMGAVCRCER